MNNAEILKEHKELSRAELIAELIINRTLLKEEKASSRWLDTLADELRDDDDSTESNKLYTEFKALKKANKKRLLEKYGIEEY